MLGRGAGFGASWSTNRHESDAGVCHGAEGAANEEDGEELLLCAQRNRRLISLEKVRHFCGVAVSLTLVLHMARFYTRIITGICI
jgi:hypothetical protein